MQREQDLSLMCATRDTLAGGNQEKMKEVGLP
jgi:hypothetical protein